VRDTSREVAIEASPLADAPISPGRRRAALVVTVLGMSAVAGSLVQTVVAPLLPRFPHLLHVSPAQAAWLVTITLLTAAISTPLLARLGDLYGRRRLLMVALALLGVGSVVCAASNSLSVLLVGRALQGGAMAAIPLGIGIVHSMSTVRHPQSAVGVISAAMGFGGAIALPAAGLVAQYADHRVLFWATGGMALLAGAGVVGFIPADPPRTEGRLDVAGFVLFAALLVTLLLPLSNGSQWGWAGRPTLGFGMAFLLLLPVFVTLERRSRAPAVDVAALVRRPVLLANAASLLTGFVMLENFVATIQYVQVPKESGYGLGFGALLAGVCLLPTGLSMAVVAPFTGRLIVGWGPRRSMLLGLAILLAGSLARLITASALGLILASSALIGVGTALAFASMPALVLAATPPSDAAAATGLNALSRSTGGTIASAVSGVVLATLTAGHGHFPTQAGFSLLAALAAAAAAVAMVLIVGIPTATARPTAPLAELPSKR
jgi:predicted MFS family arabinose efflux permease